MATLSDVDLTKISTEAAEQFSDAYYTALNANKSTIKTFYVQTVGADPDRAIPRINYNGEVYHDAGRFQDEFSRHEFVFYEPQSVDAHVLNPHLGVNEGKTAKEASRNMSLTVQVSGFIRLEQRKEGPMRGFSDSFILVPNVEATGGTGTGTGKHDSGRRWLIRSQNFRYVV